MTPRPAPNTRPAPETAGTLAARIRPTSARRDRVLPVLEPLKGLFSDGGLRRGTVVGIDPGEGAGRPGHRGTGAGGATTLGFALLASATAAGAWCAAVGTAGPGVLSMAELGIEPSRLAIVAAAGRASTAGTTFPWPEVAAILLDGMDAVLLRPPWPVRPQAARRLAART
jgi:hypothetical protein